MEITYYGHSCFGILLEGKHLLFDPFVTPNDLAKDIDIMSIKADYILISHGHEDHVADAVAIAKNTGARVISNFEIINWLTVQGIKNVHPMNHGGNVNLEGINAKYVNAVHSSILPDGTYGGNPGGFVLTSNDKNFYYAGDTALTMDMKLIPMSAKLDLSFLPIGDTFTMGVNDAVLAADFTECKKVIGMHYDTFPPISIDREKAINTFKASGKELILMNIGETKEF